MNQFGLKGGAFMITENRITELLLDFQTQLSEEGYLSQDGSTLELDSIAFIKFIVLLEDEFNIHFDVDKIDVENFKTIHDLTVYIEDKFQNKELECIKNDII